MFFALNTFLRSPRFEARHLPLLEHAGQTEPLPPLDLGQTNILDGEDGPGRLLEIITFGSGAGRLADPDGRSVPGDNEQQIISAVAHPILDSAGSVLGAHPGVEVLFTISYVTMASRRAAPAATPGSAT